MGLPGSAALARRIPLSDLRPPEGVASAPPAVRVCRLWPPPDVRHGWDDLPGHPQPAHRLVSGDVGRHQSEDRDERADAAAGAGLGQLPNGLDLAAQAATGDGAARPGPARRLRRSGRDVRRGRRGWRQWPRGQEKGPDCRRCRGRRPAAGPDSAAPGTGRVGEQPPGLHRRRRRARQSGAHGWLGWATSACRRTATGTGLRTLSEHPEPANQLLPRVHLVTSLLKRWLLGTHQGAVSPAHLDYYLDEFTFRFNRRRSRHRGMLFYRLAQQAVQVAPVPYTAMVKDVGRLPDNRNPDT